MTEEWSSKRGDKKRWHWLTNLTVWTYKKAYNWEVTLAWRSAKDQYSYFAESSYVKEDITFDANTSITDLIQEGVQAGDVIYLDLHGNGIEHAIMVTEVTDDDVIYAAHTEDACDKPFDELFTRIDNLSGHILIFNDK